MTTEDLATRFARDGVVHLPAAIARPTLDLAFEAWSWSLAHPGPGAARLPDRGDGTFYQDLANPAAIEAYRTLLAAPEIADHVAALWGTPEVWFMYEQVFHKSGGTTRRTPWHQDAPYLPVRGADLAVMWLSFEAVPASRALEFVRGSHRATLYDGSRFDPDDDTAPLGGDGTLPRLPDIEANRDAWPIVSFATEPGDVVVFHPAVLHGGAPTAPGDERRTLSLRFFGADAVVANRSGRVRPEAGLADGAHPLTRMRGLADGSAFRDPGFPQLRG
jgi:ectoine hydroxylase-related dioxygenase (phytanoyl-CoA dioxygenase family)